MSSAKTLPRQPFAYITVSAIVSFSLALVIAGCSARTGPNGSGGYGGGGGGGPVSPPPQVTGWTDLKQLLVASDGTHSLGNASANFNDTRDKGSKIVFFDNSSKGNNSTAEVYWWDGTNLVDSRGDRADSSGNVYGTDPLYPNEQAIKTFRQATGMASNSSSADQRLRTNGSSCATCNESLWPSATAGGYPDWFLFRRGQVHDTFDGNLFGGASESHPMVVAGYGPIADGRAVMAPSDFNPFDGYTGNRNPIWLHLAYFGLEIHGRFSIVQSQDTDSQAGGPVTALVEDCSWIQHDTALGAALLYLPQKTRVRRSIIANTWTTGSLGHGLGYYTDGYKAQVTFEEAIFYRNGFLEDPAINPDPARDGFSRNIYQGGGAWMGHTYRNIISADGASGGPQMRLGGLCENSLIIEGYWWSGTESNGEGNPWMTTANQQSGNPSAIVRNNVQLVLAYPSARDPDSTGGSDPQANPGWGYQLLHASFGSVVEANIISNATLEDDLGSSGGAGGSFGINLEPLRESYENGTFTQLNNTIRNNIVYRTGQGLYLSGDWTGTAGDVVENNVFATGSVTGSLGVRGTPIYSEASSLSSASQLTVRNNRFYAGSGASLPAEAWMGTGNTLAASNSAASTEGWPDPDRTLKRYVTEVLGLTLLDWNDDPFLDGRYDTGTEYDPTGLKTFMAVATNMRYGGREPIPTSGKPSWMGDYPWDERFTGKAVVNWVRQGFGLAAVE